MLRGILQSGRRLAEAAPPMRAAPLGRPVQRLLSTAGYDHDLVTCEVDAQGVALITLNDAPRLNALTVDMGDCLSDTVARLRTDNSIRAAVLTGAGTAFSAGGDLRFLVDRTKSPALDNAEVMRQFYSRFLAVRTLPVPIIAAINGAAIGAGLCLAAGCDVRVAATSAKMGWTFVGLGLHPGMAATHFTPELIGSQQAARLLLTGEVFDGTEAERIGLVLEATAPEAVLPRAMSLAHSMAAASPIAVRSCVASLRLRANEGLEKALAREADSQAHSYASADILEGLQAVKEKRRPNFS